jgi:hypothetical protein
MRRTASWVAPNWTGWPRSSRHRRRHLGGPFGSIFHTVYARDPRAGDEVYVYDPVTGADVTEG